MIPTSFSLQDELQTRLAKIDEKIEIETSYNVYTCNPKNPQHTCKYEDT